MYVIANDQFTTQGHRQGRDPGKSLSNPQYPGPGHSALDQVGPDQPDPGSSAKIGTSQDD